MSCTDKPNKIYEWFSDLKCKLDLDREFKERECTDEFECLQKEITKTSDYYMNKANEPINYYHIVYCNNNETIAPINKYELIKLDDVGICTHIINYKIKELNVLNYLIPDADVNLKKTIIEILKDLFTKFRSVSKIWTCLLNVNSPLIKYPNKFIKMAEYHELYLLYDLIKDVEGINYDLLTDKYPEYSILHFLEIAPNQRLLDINKIVKKYNVDDGLLLYRLIVYKDTLDKESVNNIINECSRDDLLILIILMSESQIVKSLIDPDNLFDICNRLHTRCLFDILSFPHLKNPNILIYNCDKYDVDYLLKVTPDRNKISINVIFENCNPANIPKYFIKMTDEDEKDFDPNIVIRKCLKTDLKRLYNKFTNEEKERIMLYYLFCRYDPSFMLDIFKSLSEEKRSTIDYDIVLAHCEGNDSIDFLKCLNK